MDILSNVSRNMIGAKGALAVSLVAVAVCACDSSGPASPSEMTPVVAGRWQGEARLESCNSNFPPPSDVYLNAFGITASAFPCGHAGEVRIGEATSIRMELTQGAFEFSDGRLQGRPDDVFGNIEFRRPRSLLFVWVSNIITARDTRSRPSRGRVENNFFTFTATSQF